MRGPYARNTVKTEPGGTTRDYVFPSTDLRRGRSALAPVLTASLPTSPEHAHRGRSLVRTSRPGRLLLVRTALVAAAPTADWRLAVVLVVLVAVAVVTSRVADLNVERQQVVAAARAAVQLSLVALVIAAVLTSLIWSVAFVALMFAVASFTAQRRMQVPGAELPWVAVAMISGAAPVIVICFASGVVPLNGAGMIPIAGIVIGNTMTASTLAGRRAFAELSRQMGCYEAALALGMRSTDAAMLVINPTASEGLLPGLDQTRTVGLVTLPGAFVGVLLGGGTPIEAGAAQLLVLIGLLATETIAVWVMTELVAHGRILEGVPR